MFRYSQSQQFSSLFFLWKMIWNNFSLFTNLQCSDRMILVQRKTHRLFMKIFLHMMFYMNLEYFMPCEQIAYLMNWTRAAFIVNAINFLRYHLEKLCQLLLTQNLKFALHNINTYWWWWWWCWWHESSSFWFSARGLFSTSLNSSKCLWISSEQVYM